MEMNLPALVVTPHPVSLHGQRVLSAIQAQFTPGESLAVVLERQGVLPGQQWAVSIGGVAVPDHQWHLVFPKHGHPIEARRLVHKDVLRLVAVVALSYFTLGAGGIAGGSFLGLTGAAGYIAAGAAFIAGSLLINKMLAPKMPGKQDTSVSPTYSLSGGRNRMRPYEPIGLVLGEPYAVPDLAAQPYTFIASGEQFLWQAFHLGLNCADATSLRVGQTALSNYQGVTVLRNGLASGNSDFPALGTSVDSVAGALLNTGIYTTRTTSPGTVRIALDVVASLYGISEEGVFYTKQVDIVAEYREVGTSTWLPFTAAVDTIPAVTREQVWENDSGSHSITVIVTPAVLGHAAGVIRLANGSQRPLRLSFEFPVAAGQYEVRMAKVTADLPTTQGGNSVEWMQLRSYQIDTGLYDGQARLAIQIQASGQLNGALDELNCQLRAKPMDYWDGSDWVTATDRASGLCNPGAIFLLLCRGGFDSTGRRLFGLGYTDAQIDIEGLKLFMVHCAEKEFEFDYFVQEAMSIEDLLDAVAYAGMGEKGWIDGRLGVTFFSRDDPIEGIINMANIKARSFEVSYATMPTAEEIEARYFDRARGNEWQPVRVKAPTIDVPSATASLSLVGVTREAHAATLARFAMAQNIYQRKSVALEMDLEYMTYRKGSVVAASHDLTQWGYNGRLLACEDVGGVITLTLDDIAPGDNPLGGSSDRFIGLRLPGEKQMRVFPVESFSGEARTVTLDGAWPVGVPLPGADAGNPARDTVWIYDFKAVPGQRLMVASIDPRANGASLGLVPISDEFWDYVETGVYQPPPNNSLLRPAPEVVSVRVSEQLARQGNTYYTDLTLSFESTGAFSRAELWGGLNSDEDTPALVLLASGYSQSLSWRGGLDERWHLEVRVYSDIQAAVPFRFYYDVIGLRAPPAPFDLFNVLAQPDGTRQFNFAYTTTPAPVDWQGAEIRYLSGAHTDPEWDDMQPLQVERSYYTASPVEINQLLSGVHTFACRSRDTTGNTSTLKYFQLALPPRRLGSTVAEFDDYAESWQGTLTDCTFNAATGFIEADNNTTWDDLTDWDAWTRWTMDPADPIVYTSPVRDLSAVLTCLVDATATVEGDSTIELRSSETSDDPDGDPGEWTAWGAADAKVVARYIQLRVTVEATGGDPVPVIAGLSYVVSAPLMNDYINDIDISALTGDYRIGTGDVRAPMTNTLGTLLELQIVIQDASAGAWSWQLIDKDLTFGPRVQFKLNGTLADPDLVDFILKGF
jgi:hypothetical protein